MLPAGYVFRWVIASTTWAGRSSCASLSRSPLPPSTGAPSACAWTILSGSSSTNPMMRYPVPWYGLTELVSALPFTARASACPATPAPNTSTRVSNAGCTNSTAYTPRQTITAATAITTNSTASPRELSGGVYTGMNWYRIAVTAAAPPRTACCAARSPRVPGRNPPPMSRRSTTTKSG